MKVGEYEFHISATGFSDFKQSGILLSVGKQARIDISLKVGGTTDSVTVSADQGKMAQQEVLGETEIRSLPIISRNVYNLHRLRPSVAATALR